MNKDELLFLKELVEYAKNNGINADFYEQLLKELVNNEYLNFKVQEKGLSTAIFQPQYSQITISTQKMNSWLNINSIGISEMYNETDKDLLKIYLALFAIRHEIAHSNQFLMSKGLIDSPNDMIKNGYKNIFELFQKSQSIIPRPYKECKRIISLTLYKKAENSYVLERNANIESLDLLCQLCLFMGKENFYKTFDNIKSQYEKIGYLTNTEGSLEETYRKIQMYKKYQKIYQDTNLSEEDCIRFGLKIKESTRKKILNVK